MLKWKFELEGYDIQYRPRTAIKGQILADFIVERPEEESPDELMQKPERYFRSQWKRVFHRRHVLRRRLVAGPDTNKSGMGRIHIEP
ncbi:hypothetical protein Tco_1174029 [Tanacetum coccineum]